MLYFIARTHDDGNDFQQTKPIFKLMPSLAIVVDHEWLAPYFTVYSDSCNVGQNQQHPKNQTQALRTFLYQHCFIEGRNTGLMKQTWE